MNTQNCNIASALLQRIFPPNPGDTIAETAEAGRAQVSMLTEHELVERLTAHELEVTLYDLERKFRLIESEVLHLINTASADLRPAHLNDPIDTITETAEAGAAQISILANHDLLGQLTANEVQIALHDLECKFRFIEVEIRRFHEIEIHEALSAKGVAL